MMDSELIRYTMRNVGLAKDGFAPTAVVTLESHRGLTEPREIYDAQHEVLESGVGATDVRFVEATLCGEQAEILDYITPTLGLLPPHPAKVLCGVLHTDDRTFAMTMTVQSADPDNPTYQRDAEIDPERLPDAAAVWRLTTRTARAEGDVAWSSDIT